MGFITETLSKRLVPFALCLAVIVFIIVFFVRYFAKLRPKKGTLEWVHMRDKPPFSLERKGKMAKEDWILLAAITCAYALLAFVYLGNPSSPQSFARFDKSVDSVTITLSEPAKIDCVFYFTGLYHDVLANRSTQEHKAYKLEFSSDGHIWYEQTWQAEEKVNGQMMTVQRHAMTQKVGETFRWLYASLLPDNPESIRYVRVSAFALPLEMGELCLVRVRPDGVREVIPRKDMTVNAAGEPLLDEQHLIPADYNILNSTHFDEIYHAYTAFQHVRNIYPYERTHPPLGKEITALGIRLFGMTPFGWRFMPTLFGVLMLPLLYVMLVWMFGKRTVSVCGTLLFSFEFMHFSQTRISTIDVYGVFFILLTYMLMICFMTQGYETPFRKAFLPLFLCGVSFGLGAASKWIVIYSGFGLLALYVLYLYRRMRHARRHEQRFAGYLLLTLAVSVLGFILIGGGLYILSYIPYALAARPEGVQDTGLFALLKDTWKECYNNQLYMYEYHAKSVLGSTHDFAARWYEWIFDYKPILYYRHNTGDMRASLWAFTNPMNTWGGLLALAACVYGVIKKRRAAALAILIGYFSQLIPWIPIERLTFPYPYFPSILFCCVALAYVFDELLERDEQNKRYVYAFTGITGVLFALFYPILSGLPVPSWYGTTFLQWLPKWTM